MAFPLCRKQDCLRGEYTHTRPLCRPGLHQFCVVSKVATHWRAQQHWTYTCSRDRTRNVNQSMHVITCIYVSRKRLVFGYPSIQYQELDMPYQGSEVFVFIGPKYYSYMYSTYARIYMHMSVDFYAPKQIQRNNINRGNNKDEF